MTKKMTWAVPKELEIPPDKLELRLDFYSQSIVMHSYNPRSVKMVSGQDIAAALARELSFSTGLLPPNTIFWRNTSHGTVTAIYQEPRKRKLALNSFGKELARYTVPLPGLIFLCLPGQSPWVYAVKRRPTKETDPVYRPPLSNVFDNGSSCPGSQKYPTNSLDIIDTFFISFFSTSESDGKSTKYKNNVTQLWAELDGKDEFPNDDLIAQGTLKDLMTMPMERY